MKKRSIVWDIVRWLFGVIVLAIGVINMFWGNDPEYGVFIFILSFVYFLPVDEICKKTTGFSIPSIGIIRILLGLFILWSALGVAELPEKVGLMMQALRK